jgi:hypothetical protein
MQRLAQISRQATGSDKCGVACVPGFSRRTTRLTSPGKTEADTTARSPGTCDPKTSWHAYQRTLIAGLALLFLIGGGGRGAQAAGSWCAFYDASTYNCGFHSFEQCRETVLGAGGWCRPNFFEDRPGGQRSRVR